MNKKVVSNNTLYKITGSMILQSFVNLILMQFYSLHQVFHFHDIKISMLLHVQFSFPKLTGIDKMI